MGFADASHTAGLYRAEVLRTERVTPHMVRVTFGGADLKKLPQHGYDQWFRLFLPVSAEPVDFSGLPERFSLGGYLKYLATKSGTRPPVRNYTVRHHRPELGELDVDFVAHGEAGIAGPWAQRAQPGEPIALIDQGRGFDPLPDATAVFLVGDESALPAIAGILRDLPRDAVGQAIIELPDEADRQELAEPVGVEVRWLFRSAPDQQIGKLAHDAVRSYRP
ncbi:MAG: siderophore-interacting protein, partial [Bifidobacteriaceae bacterium]|nr:siderophore-interacting protein [Bifidobacteriaceae bacterium]